MKKIFLLPVVALLAIVMISCNGNNNASTSQQQSGAPATEDSTAKQDANAQPGENNLPEEISAFVKQHFPNTTIANVKTEKDANGMEFDLTLNDSTEIDFDANKQWNKVECKAGAVPEKIVPQAIATYAKDNYQEQAIIEIDKNDKGGYEIKLANGVELKFDEAGKFLSVDK